MNVNIINGFNVLGKIPLDERESVAVLSDVKTPYEGLLTFQQSDCLYYKYTNGVWVNYLGAINTELDNINTELDNHNTEIDGNTTKLTDIQTKGVMVGIGTPSGIFSVRNTRATINFHAFEDEVQLNTTDTGLGYASYDAQPTMNNPLTEEHFVGFQSRLRYTGVGNLVGYMDAFNTNAVHTGTGVIQKSRGMYIKDVEGSGPIVESYGLYIEAIGRGSSKNYDIFSIGTKNSFGGILTGRDAFSMNYGVDVNGKSMTIGYGYAGVVNYGKIDFYDGKTTVLMSITKTQTIVNNDLLVKGAIISDTLVLHKGYTYATLPACIDGGICYCTNGRKVGQGAGAGTGVMVYYSAGAWRNFVTDAVVLA